MPGKYWSWRDGEETEAAGTKLISNVMNQNLFITAMGKGL